jgi:hypothetical protein
MGRETKRVVWDWSMASGVFRDLYMGRYLALGFMNGTVIRFDSIWTLGISPVNSHIPKTIKFIPPKLRAYHWPIAAYGRVKVKET